jgi:hypothetical protein
VVGRSAESTPLDDGIDRSTASRRRRVGPWFDATVMAGLFVLGYALRRDALPSRSLWFDDAWVVGGALHLRPSQIIIAGSAHPGFTIALKLWHGIVGGGAHRFVYLPLLVGCVGPPLLYIGLRSLRFARSICLLLSAALVVAKIHVLYSGRVKPYTLDVVLVLVLLVTVPRLASIRWRWTTAAAWVIGAVLVGTFSGNVMLATALAAVILVLHPVGDLVVRVVALAVQGVVQLFLYVQFTSASDLDGIERFMAVYDGHMDLHANPVTLLNEVLTHAGRVAEVYPGGSGTWLRLLAVAAVGGLVLGAIRPRHRAEAVAARLGLALVCFAVVGAFLERFPFGPSSYSLYYPGVSPGSRHSLWLVPIFALGLAVVLMRLRMRLGGSHRTVFDVVAVVATVAVFVLGHGEPFPYPSDQAPAATRLVDESIDAADVVIITDTRVYAFALYTSQGVVLAPTPTHQVPYTPTFRDQRIHGLGTWSTRPLDARSIKSLVAGAHEVVVYDTEIGAGADTKVEPTMIAEGFTKARVRAFGNDLVTIWKRG